MDSSITINSAKWDASAFDVSDSDDEEVDGGDDKAEDEIARTSSYSRDNDMSGSYLQNLVVSGSGVVNYLSDWTPMKFYNDVVGSPPDVEKEDEIDGDVDYAAARPSRMSSERHAKSE